MKLILNVSSGSINGKSFELTRGFISIGRSENSSVRFDPLNEKIVSKQHAFIEARPGGFYPADGTLFNSQGNRAALLNSGDVIQFGRERIAASDPIIPDPDKVLKWRCEI